MQSKKFQLNQVDLKKWLNNTLIFAAPALLIFLTQIESGKSIKEASAVLYVWVLNTLIDILKKYLAGK